MPDFLFPPIGSAPLEIRGESRVFPVNRIFCVGRNYALHAAEMGFEVDREEPFYFTKSPQSFLPSGREVPYPPGTQNYHHEIELVAFLRAEVFEVPVDDALDAVFGYACGLDMTRRDLQIKARERGRPWDLGKDFEHSAVFAPITPTESFGELGAQSIALSVNGEVRQQAQLSDLIWSVEEIIAHLSQFYRLLPGDAIMTGTPAGVGAVAPGDHIHGTIDGLDPVSLQIEAAQ